MLDRPAVSCSCIVDSGKRRSVRITLEVTPALNVRMSIRFAGPHFETKNSQDHAATNPRSISVAALSQRSLLVPSFISVHSENPPGFALSALQAYAEANHRGLRPIISRLSPSPSPRDPYFRFPTPPLSHPLPTP